MIPQMSVRCLSMRLFLTISVAMLGAILLFLGFSRVSPPSFYRSATGHSSFGGDSLQHVANKTLGVSTTYIYLTVTIR